MSEGSANQRAFMLMQTNRPELAEKELRRALAENPDDAWAHAYLALCLSQQKRHEDALAEANLAIHHAPQWAYVHYVRGAVLDALDDLDEAEKAGAEATRLDPTDADYWRLRAGIAYQKRQWQQAAQWARQGLSHDADNVGCLRIRSMALTMLGQKEEARHAAAAALAKDPENSRSHAVQGWNYLHQNDPKAALEHFREALRIEPANEYARHGLVRALKARHLVYRLMLQYFMWVSRQSRNVRLGVIVGIYLAVRMLFQTSRSSPAFAAVAIPLGIAVIGFCLLSWFADPVFNLTLVLNKNGWNALTPFVRTGTLIWGGLLAAAIGTGLAGWLLGVDVLLATAIFCGAMLLPTAAAFKFPAVYAKKAMLALCAVAGVGLAAIGCWAVGQADWQSVAWIFLLGCGGFGWIFNAIMLQDRQKRRARRPAAQRQHSSSAPGAEDEE